MLLILSENPTDAAYAIPIKIRHKQLLEFMQMISCVVDFGYKQVPQGKEIKEWISKNTTWCYSFAKLLLWFVRTDLSAETRCKYDCLLELLRLKGNSSVAPNLKTAVFRYTRDYKNTDYKSNTELPIKEAVQEYRKYVEWKSEKWL